MRISDWSSDVCSSDLTGAAASAVVSISNSTITLQAPTGTDLATIDLNAFPTVQQVVDRINSISGFTASVLDGNGEKLALNGLDSVTAQDIKTADFDVTANLQAIVDSSEEHTSELQSLMRLSYAVFC